MSERVTRMGEDKDTYEYDTQVGKPEGKRPFGIRRSKRNNDFKMYYKEAG